MKQPKGKTEAMIRNVYPELDGGQYPVKTEIDRGFAVEAEVTAAGPLKVWLQYRRQGEKTWRKVRMEVPAPPASPTRYRGVARFDQTGPFEYTVSASAGKGSASKSSPAAQYRTLPLFVEPVVTRFGAWYELFPRSQGKVPGKSGTFKDCEDRLEDIHRMGFDVIYLAPIHPIGHTNRKGPNNTLWAGPGDPGCVWSIGDETGGHTAIHPELGTLEDFRRFVRKAGKHGIRIALDMALTCSYDHPWLKQHPDWFFHNPDGTIRYAENPPKKYEDTVFLNFYPPDRERMWNELKAIFSFWIRQGVTIFRIDNPHTKPDDFWAWVIPELKKECPDVFFLSEAFTYYERLELLAKLGFSQSYNYFTWRNNKNEMLEYLTRLTQSYLKDFLRPNFFTNTPDILPTVLQEGGRPAFKLRLALAAALSPAYGVYSTFELCENRANPGAETYQNSEKYEYKAWDWDRPGNIKDYIASVNRIRRENPALQTFDNLLFCSSTNEHILAYAKATLDGANRLLVVFNFNLKETHSSRITVPVEKLGFGSDESYRAVDLLSGRAYTWKGRENYVLLDPSLEPAQFYLLEAGEAEKPDLSRVRSPQAEGNARLFFDFQDQSLRNSDILARRQMSRIYQEVIAPKVYSGPAYDEAYHAVIDAIARKRGWESIIDAYIRTPGH
jgi:starch synthase (maltosyl-transferring)